MIDHHDDCAAEQAVTLRVTVGSRGADDLGPSAAAGPVSHGTFSAPARRRSRSAAELRLGGPGRRRRRPKARGRCPAEPSQAGPPATKGAAPAAGLRPGPQAASAVAAVALSLTTET